MGFGRGTLWENSQRGGHAWVPVAQDRDAGGEPRAVEPTGQTEDEEGFRSGAEYVGHSAPADMPHNQSLASRIRLNGVSAARRNRVSPPCWATSRSRASPACAPSPRPTS